MIFDSEKLNPQYNQNSVLTIPGIAWDVTWPWKVKVMNQKFTLNCAQYLENSCYSIYQQSLITRYRSLLWGSNTVAVWSAILAIVGFLSMMTDYENVVIYWDPTTSPSPYSQLN